MQFSLEDFEDILEMFDYIHSDPAWRHGSWNPDLEAKIKEMVSILKDEGNGVKEI